MSRRSRQILTSLLLVLAAPAGASELGTIDMQAQLTLPNAGNITDVWGYVDPSSGKEYALVGNRAFPGSGIHLIDVSDPLNPSVTRHITSVDFVFNSFDMKTFGPYVYCVNGLGSGFGRVIDLSNIEVPVVGGQFPNAHNLAVDPRGYLYLLGAGSSAEVKLCDLNANPLVPPRVWEDNIANTHDAVVVGDRLYDFHGGNGTRIYDISDPRAPSQMGRITDPAVSFHHSGYPTEDGRHLFITNELANHPMADITVWNIEDLSNPYLVASVAESTASVHNLYIIGNYAYVSHYTLGFHVYDVSDPTNPRLADSHDTSPLSGEGFDGAFGVYPFTPSGTIYVSDIDLGLYVYSFTPPSSAVLFRQFDVTYTDGAVVLSWAIGESYGLMGYHVYRSERRDAGFERITEALLGADASGTYRDESAHPGRTYYYRLGAIDNDGEFPSPVRSVTVPAAATILSQNYPNPFNPVTTISFDLEAAGDVRLSVHDARGGRIRTLAAGFHEAGPHSVKWDGTDDARARVASGTYFYRLQAGGRVLTRRMILLK